MALVAFAGHVHGVVVLFGVTSVVGVALPTAVGLFASAIAILALDPEDGVFAILLRPSAAGRHTRYLALAALAIPFGGAVLFRGGELLGLYDSSFRSAAYVASTALLLFAVVIAAARSLLHAEAQREQLAIERSAREVAERVAHELREHVAERKRAAEALREREERLAVTLRSIGDAVIATDASLRVTLLNGVAEELTGWTAEEAAGVPLSEVFKIIDEDTRLAARCPADQVLREGVVVELANHAALLRRDGTERRIADSAAPIRDSAGRTSGAVLVFRDQTAERQRRKALRESKEEALARATQLEVVSRLYAVLSRVNEAIVRTRDEGSLFAEVCRIVVQEGGFPLVWVGLVQGRSVLPVASFGPAVDYLRGIKVEVDGELGQGPPGTCVREGRAVINDDFDSNPSTKPWRAAALAHDLRASASFPLRRQGRVAGSLTLYANRPGTFTPQHLELLEALCADVSYALDAMEQERLRAEAEGALRESELILREVDERKNNFLAMLSHELRNPLAPIRNSLHLLERVPAGSSQATRAKEVLGRQVDHMTKLVDDSSTAPASRKGGARHHARPARARPRRSPRRGTPIRPVRARAGDLVGGQYPAGAAGGRDGAAHHGARGHWPNRGCLPRPVHRGGDLRAAVPAERRRRPPGKA